MFEDLPSLTAMYVAAARGVASYDASLSRACHDPFAQQLLPAPLPALIVTASKSPRFARAVRYASLGILDHLALRTGMIDAEVRAAYDSGVRQFVLLGAGLDARAHRLGLSDAVVFEVDHPATQRYKRMRTRSWPGSVLEIRYVANDFGDASLEAALRDAGFDLSQRSCVVWEGVTMYLSEPAVDNMLAVLSRASSTRTRLVTTYVTQAPTRRSLSWRPGMALLSAVGEPFKFNSSPEAMSQRLLRHGFTPLSDTQPLSQAPNFNIESLPVRVAGPVELEHVVIAERRAD